MSEPKAKEGYQKPYCFRTVKEEVISETCNEMHLLAYEVVEIKQCRRNYGWFNILFYYQGEECKQSLCVCGEGGCKNDVKL